MNRTWAAGARQSFGDELPRLEKQEEPPDCTSMDKTLAEGLTRSEG